MAPQEPILHPPLRPGIRGCSITIVWHGGKGRCYPEAGERCLDRRGGTPDTKMAAGITSSGSTHSRACTTSTRNNTAANTAVTVRTSAPNLRAIRTTTLLAEIPVITMSGLAPHSRAGEHNPADKKGGTPRNSALQSLSLPIPLPDFPLGGGELRHLCCGCKASM